VWSLWVFLICTCIHHKYSQVFGARKYGGRLINEALDHVLGRRKFPGVYQFTGPYSDAVEHTALPITRVRLRCQHFSACENTTPTIEIDNAITHNKMIYINKPDQESIAVINKFPAFFAPEPGRLPSCLSKLIDPEWLPGPKFFILNDTHLGSSGPETSQYPRSCGQFLDTSAHILFPWQHVNSFHALNDNVLKVLASLLIQRHLREAHDVIETNHTTLYVFDTVNAVFSLRPYL
jgi:hypothetical protein